MVPGISKDIRCHVPQCSLAHLQIMSLIRQQVKWAASLVTADSNFNLHRGLRGHLSLNILTHQQWPVLSEPRKTSVV